MAGQRGHDRGTDARDVFITPLGGTPVQGAVHTIDFGSVDAALPFDYDPLTWLGPSWHWGNLEGTSWIWSGLKDAAYIEVFTGYQTRSVKLDVTAPVVTAMDPTNGEWQKGPAVVNFSGTDVGSGYATPSGAPTAAVPGPRASAPRSAATARSPSRTAASTTSG